uniref:uncharacterized protein LOC120808254 isoform X3 n=1 Tax=Gasterosteus aculeatus aculeatus TaxID=481459 RepID=UPI001A993645|nr:uncharacterized protein LOC120808254 isoform X3 [Gasterosteus aculeatus aculeatus]
MVELRGTQRTLCVMLLLLQAAVRGQTPPVPRFLVRAGDDVTLPSNQDRCNGSTWLHSRSDPAVELVTLGKIKNNALIPEAKTNRLSLTANCSLVIRNVSGEGVGRYTNRHYDEGGKHQGPDGVVSLYVFTMEEKDYGGLVVLSCFVLRFSECEHTVKWHYDGKQTDVTTSHVACEANVTFKAPLHQKSKYYKSLRCEVRDTRSGKTLLFEACSQFSCEQTVRGQTPPDPRFLVRAGDDVTLPSNHVDQDRCDGSTWLYNRTDSSVELVTLGKINNNALIPEAKSNKLSLTANCSLVIRSVSGEDVGRYTNRDFNEAGKQQGPDGVVSLSMFTMEEKDYGGLVVFSCFVLRFSECEHTVEWLYDGKQTDVMMSHAACEATVTFKAPLHQKSKYYKSLRCEVRDNQSGKTLLFEACSQFSSEQTGGPSGEGNITPPAPPGGPSGEDNITPPAQSDSSSVWWPWLVIPLVGLLVLFIILVVFIRWRNQGKRTQTDENIADPEEGVAYASVSYTRTAGGGARSSSCDRFQARVKDGDDAVTYCTVKAPPPASSSGAGASVDPSDLYAVVNKPNK